MKMGLEALCIRCVCSIPNLICFIIITSQLKENINQVYREYLKWFLRYLNDFWKDDLKYTMTTQGKIF